MIEQDFCTLVLVRHGETDWNTQQLIQGHQQTVLNSNGENQAFTLRQELQGIPFDAIYASDLARASQTAEIIAQGQKGLIVQTSEMLREKNYGSFEGKTLAELNTIIADGSYDPRGIESDTEMLERVTLCLKEISASQIGKSVLIVTHGGVLRTLLIYLGFATIEELSFYAVGNGAKITIQSDGIDFFIRETKGVTI